MTIGVVIASYKYGHLASQAIDSVISQTRKADKIWFVDDGIGDCKHLQSIYPKVEYIFRDTNMGIVDNFQDMLNRVNTDHVMFLGADNWLRADTLELLEGNISDIVLYNIIVTGELRDEITKRHPDEVQKYRGDWYWNRKGHHGSMLYNTELAKKVGGYNAGYGKRTLEDLSLYERMVQAGAKKKHVPEGLLYYRRHRENYNPCGLTF